MRASSCILVKSSVRLCTKGESTDHVHDLVNSRGRRTVFHHVNDGSHVSLCAVTSFVTYSRILETSFESIFLLLSCSLCTTTPHSSSTTTTTHLQHQHHESPKNSFWIRQSAHATQRAPYPSPSPSTPTYCPHNHQPRSPPYLRHLRAHPTLRLPRCRISSLFPPRLRPAQNIQRQGSVHAAFLRQLRRTSLDTKSAGALGYE